MRSGEDLSVTRVNRSIKMEKIQFLKMVSEFGTTFMYPVLYKMQLSTISLRKMQRSSTMKMIKFQYLISAHIITINNAVFV